MDPDRNDPPADHRAFQPVETHILLLDPSVECYSWGVLETEVGMSLFS
ncbi:hypothetical protein NITLEN_30407 [Nitrospira lenta]|uniref:Uncharacterized protein n=1 Tax=Nitrospira lenta TaxID=1436998 RepID=A0A330L8T1_9BACT|nr:hypothetical protein NITLEN_30407 [Nitrospira lenta]